MYNEIDIKKECLEFVNLQVCGECHEEERQRLTLVSLSSEAKKLLTSIKDFLYFGEPLNYTEEQLESVKKVLKRLKVKVTSPEMNLINYLSLLLIGSKDKAMFQNLQRYYNDALVKQQQRYLVGA